MSINVLTVFGTRPEAIKMAPVVLALENEAGIHSQIVVTAQHREMLDQVINLFDIKPDFDLNIMSAGQDLYDVTAKVLLGMRDVFKATKPDLVLIHGDTTTCFATALAAFYAGIKVGHVEAGLRTHNLKAPFPEEANRTLAGVISNYHFAPTERSRKNLEREHIESSRIIVTGNTVTDALLWVVAKLKSYSEDYWRQYFDEELLAALADVTRRLVLITGHRRENFGQGFVDLCRAIKQLALENPDVDFVYPVHLNPNVQKPVKEILSGIGNVYLIEPLDYLPFVYLMEKSYFILTDSGGVQEEAPTLGKPVLVMRDVTERPEAVEAGTVRLVGTDQDKIVLESRKLLRDRQLYQQMASAHNPYGDGHASERIVNYIKTALG